MASSTMDATLAADPPAVDSSLAAASSAVDASFAAASSAEDATLAIASSAVDAASATALSIGRECRPVVAGAASPPSLPFAALAPCSWIACRSAAATARDIAALPSLQLWAPLLSSRDCGSAPRPGSTTRGATEAANAAHRQRSMSPLPTP